MSEQTIERAVTFTLSAEDAQRVYELVVARAVQLESAAAYVAPYAPPDDPASYRRPADVIRQALDA